MTRDSFCLSWRGVKKRIRILGLSLAASALLPRTGVGGLFYPDVSPTNVFWPGGMIPFEFETNVTAAQRATYLDGLREWELAGNIHLIPRTTETNYLLLRFYFQQQTNTFTLDPPVLTVDSLTRLQICHEMGHALGLNHEHTRADRNSFISVNYANLDPPNAYLYDIDTNSTPFGAYDFESVMHYGRRLFAIDPDQDVMVPLPAYFAKYYYRIGTLATSVGDRAAVAYLYGPPVTPLTNIVTTTRDGGFGSLRAAIYFANDHPGTTISFNISTNDPGYSHGVWTIQPTGEYPPLVADGTVIDGETQSGYTNHPVIALDGSALLPEAYSSSGLYIDAANCTVKNIALHQFTYSGIVLQTISATNNAVLGCNVGLDAAGTSPAPNAYEGVGIFLGACNNHIGGSNAGDRNAISGNAHYGVLITGTNTAGNVVAGNYVGLDVTGTNGIPNGLGGIAIFGGAGSNTVGGYALAARNVISGNSGYGVVIADPHSDANAVIGNFIGTDATGTLALSNAYGGVGVLGQVKRTAIGGTHPGEGNLISGNAGFGLVVADPGTDDTAVLGNFFGTDATGLLAVPNDFGIGIFSQSKNTIVGGTDPAAGNTVSGNRYTGILVADTNTTGTVIQGNYVGLAADGMTAIGNGGIGVHLFAGARNTLIGGSSAGAGNVIAGNGGDGISLFGGGTTSNSIAGNLIGTDKLGVNALPNQSGVSLIDGPQFNTTGGTSPGSRNLISGNAYNGLYFAGSASSNNAILGNWIGTALDGVTALGNHSDNIALVNGAANNIVGGSTASARNVIAASTYSGILIADPGTTGNVILGNLIGTDQTGLQSLGNGGEGIAIFNGAHHNLIGGNAPGAGNVIGASVYRGIFIADTNTTGNLIQGNSIGVGADGVTPLPNGFEGITFANGAATNVVGLNLDNSGTGNQIAFNTFAGIYVGDFDESGACGNTIRGNQIYSNGYLGIDLAGGTEDFNGVTTNDSTDADTGPNNLQNHPLVTAAAALPGTTLIEGALNSRPDHSYLIDVYWNPAADSSGYGEGQTCVGSANLNTDGNGDGSFSLAANRNLAGDYLTATATDQSSGDTSEFSPAVLATNAPPPPQFTGPCVLDSNGFAFHITLLTNRNYRLQVTTNVAANPIPWVDLTNFTPDNSLIEFIDRAGTNYEMRFYRVVSP